MPSVTPEESARQTVESDVHSLAAGHLTLVPELRDATAQLGAPSSPAAPTTRLGHTSPPVLGADRDASRVGWTIAIGGADAAGRAVHQGKTTPANSTSTST